jgi:hypothetical protein
MIAIEESEVDTVIRSRVPSWQNSRQVLFEVFFSPGMHDILCKISAETSK